MKKVLITFLIGVLALCSGAIERPDLTKFSVEDGVKRLDETKDLEESASDRSFLIGRDYGYGSFGGNYGYGNYPGGIYGNNRYAPNSVYRGYSTGINGIPGGNTGYGYYGSNYGGLGSGYYGSGYGGYGGYGSGGYGAYGNGYDSGILGTGYNRWSSLDGYGYSGIGGTGYGGYSGYGNYPNGYRGAGSGFYGGYPSGYRGYS